MQIAFEHKQAHDRYTHVVRKLRGNVEPTVSAFVIRYAGDGISQTDSTHLAHLGASVIPEDPPFLNERFKDDFQYSFLPDTVLMGRNTRIIAVTAVPADSDLHAIREALYYIDQATGRTVAIRHERQAASLFYGEQSTYWVRLRPGPSEGSWVPFQVQIQTGLRLLHKPSLWLQRNIAFYNYGVE